MQYIKKDKSKETIEAHKLGEVSDLPKGVEHKVNAQGAHLGEYILDENKKYWQKYAKGDYLIKGPGGEHLVVEKYAFESVWAPLQKDSRSK